MQSNAACPSPGLSPEHVIMAQHKEQENGGTCGPPQNIPGTATPPGLQYLSKALCQAPEQVWTVPCSQESEPPAATGPVRGCGGGTEPPRLPFLSNQSPAAPPFFLGGVMSVHLYHWPTQHLAWRSPRGTDCLTCICSRTHPGFFCGKRDQWGSQRDQAPLSRRAAHALHTASWKPPPAMLPDSLYT